jgi:hypothetical protein
MANFILFDRFCHYRNQTKDSESELATGEKTDENDFAGKILN